jgi:prepilin-type processing-associated H-X9-DG protein
MRNAVNVAVVVVIVVVGFGLFVSFLTRSGEAALRLKCQHHLRDLGQAVSMYYDRYRSFPPGTLPPAALPPAKRLSWLVALLPFLGHDVLYQQIDKDRPWDAGANRTAVTRRLPFFLCPTHARRGVAEPSGLTHYVGLAGVGPDAAFLPAEDARAGFFGYDRTIAPAAVADGLSTTAAALETAFENGPWAAGAFATVRGLDPSRQPYLGQNRPFGGIHPGGANVLFGDGSARFLSEAINAQVFEDLATIAGGKDR